jgi:hypothetical protein
VFNRHFFCGSLAEMGLMGQCVLSASQYCGAVGAGPLIATSASNWTRKTTANRHAVAMIHSAVVPLV